MKTGFWKSLRANRSERRAAASEGEGDAAKETPETTVAAPISTPRREGGSTAATSVCGAAAAWA